jgi:hypothetical protein
MSTKTDRANVRRTFLLSAAALAGAGVAAGCGGGDKESPTVRLYAIPTSGAVGDTITLSAMAQDDERVSEVRVYRVASNSETLLATFSSEPYLLQTAIPAGATGSVVYRARATDNEGLEATSSDLSIAVTP